MQRVKRASAYVSIPDPPEGGTPGYFGPGDPAAPVSATIPGYEWFNSVQEEIIAPILWAGLSLDENNRGQLLAALQAKFAQISTVLGPGQSVVNVLASRAFNTTYTNSTGKPIVVYVQGTSGGANSAIGIYLSGGEVTVDRSSTVGAVLSVTALVPAGATYEVATSGTAPMLNAWRELR